MQQGVQAGEVRVLFHIRPHELISPDGKTGPVIKVAQDGSRKQPLGVTGESTGPFKV